VTIEIVLTTVLLACTIGLEILARRMRRDPDTIYELIVLAFGLCLLIWVPAFGRSVVVGGFCVIVMFGLGLGFVLFVLGVVIATALWLPGGVSALVLGIIAIAGVSQIRAARRHLVRLSRAATLVANEPVRHEVELTGTIRAVSPTVDPVFGEPCAMWKVEAKATRESGGLVEIRGDTGSAIIDPTSVRLEWSRSAKIVDGDDAKKAAEALRVELHDDDKLLLYVLPEDTECYVVGTPTWEIAPANTVGLYRDAPVLPTFRSTPDQPAWFADRSEAQLRFDHAWAIVWWVTWGAVCAAIATVQLGGWA
jgi:hypothetical protein